MCLEAAKINISSSTNKQDNSVGHTFLVSGVDLAVHRRYYQYGYVGLNSCKTIVYSDPRQRVLSLSMLYFDFHLAYMKPPTCLLYRGASIFMTLSNISSISFAQPTAKAMIDSAMGRVAIPCFRDLRMHVDQAL